MEDPEDSRPKETPQQEMGKRLMKTLRQIQKDIGGLQDERLKEILTLQLKAVEIGARDAFDESEFYYSKLIGLTEFIDSLHKEVSKRTDKYKNLNALSKKELKDELKSLVVVISRLVKYRKSLDNELTNFLKQLLKRHEK